MEVLPGLDTFLLVARLGTTAAAARQLGVPRSTVSRRIEALEANVGQVLLVRSPRGLRPTEAGALLIERGRSLVAELRDVELEVRAFGKEPEGTLRAALPPGLGMTFVGPFLGELRRRWPALKVDLRVRETPPDLLDEDLDVVLCEGPLPASPWYVRRIGPADRVVVASPHLIERQGEPTLEALGSYDLLSLSAPNDAPRAWPLRAGGALAVSPVFITTDHQTLALAAAEGLGLALLPVHVAAPLVMSGALVQVVPEVGREAPLLAVTAHGRRNFPKVRAFFSLIDDFVSRFSPEPGAFRGH